MLIFFSWKKNFFKVKNKEDTIWRFRFRQTDDYLVILEKLVSSIERNELKRKI